MKLPLRLLINGITFETAILAPHLLNVKYWQGRSCKITYLGTSVLKKRIEETNIIENFDFVEVKGKWELNSRLSLITEGLRRNLIILFGIKEFKNKYDVIYSRSSVLDLVIFPYFLKIFDKNIKWATVFDNIVPLKDSGKRLIRLLAWSFFHLSLIFLRKADYIFVISDELKDYLIRRGYGKDKVVLTGNAVETNLIKKAKCDKKYDIDVLFIGRINETKGIYDMLNVLEMVNKKYPDFQLAVMGRGDATTEREFKQKIKEMGMEKNVQFLGYKTGLEKFNIIKSSKIFLFLSKSKSESFGIALLEAVCCGVKAFAYKLKPYENIYKHGEVNLFSIGDYRSVAKEVIKTFDDKSFGNSKGELLVDKYNWDRIAEIELKHFLA